MICQLCLDKPATVLMTKHLSSGYLEEAHYCAECYEAKYVKPPPTAGDFPRPRFTLKNVRVVKIIDWPPITIIDGNRVIGWM